MKKSILLGILFFGGATFAQAKEIKVKVNGMVCGFCAQGISKKFKENPAVSKVDVNLSSKIVTLSTQGAADIDNATIDKVLKDAGYNVEKVERSE